SAGRAARGRSGHASGSDHGHSPRRAGALPGGPHRALDRAPGRRHGRAARGACGDRRRDHPRGRPHEARARTLPHRAHPPRRAPRSLAMCGTPIPPALLRAHPQIVLSDSANDPAAPSLNVLEGGVRWSVTDVTAKRDVILAGMGWGGLPEHVVADLLASRVLVRLDIPEFEVHAMELFTMRRRDRPHGVVAQALWEALGGSGPRSPAPRRRRS